MKETRTSGPVEGLGVSCAQHPPGRPGKRPPTPSHRERELAAIIRAYHGVTEQLKVSHERLNEEVAKLRQELEQKNRELSRRERLVALGEMAAGVAHEIRNPLGSIRLYASLLERDLADAPQSRDLVRKMCAGVGALDKIVSDILDFAGHRAPQCKNVDLKLIVSSVFDMLALKADEQGVQMRMDGRGASCDLRVDRVQMERALLNMVQNGIEATPAGGVVCVSAEETQHQDGSQWVAISVQDDGCGIDESIMDRVFNPFFTTRADGTGLGLAIVHRIVESHGGVIQVQNRKPRGACFRMVLPGHRRRSGK